MAESNFNGTWTLTQQEYQQLKRDSEFLANLEAAGVDNWDGYHYGYGNDEDEEY